MKMKHLWLHDTAKFAAGLVTADFLCGWWLSVSHLLPINFLGVMLTQDMVLPWMLFDLAMLIIFIHYGWNIGKAPLLEKRTFLNIVGVIFGLVAIAHFIRLVIGIDIIIFNWIVPYSVSWIGVVAAGYLSYMSFHLAAYIDSKK